MTLYLVGAYHGRARTRGPVQADKRGELYAKVLNLKDLRPYQKGTVACRMLINKKAGTITIFSFDESESLSEHTASYDAVVTVIDGACDMWIAGETIKIKWGRRSYSPPTNHMPSVPS